MQGGFGAKQLAESVVAVCEEGKADFKLLYPGTQFTCITGTKVQILTHAALQRRADAQGEAAQDCDDNLRRKRRDLLAGGGRADSTIRAAWVCQLN